MDNSVPIVGLNQAVMEVDHGDLFGDLPPPAVRPVCKEVSAMQRSAEGVTAGSLNAVLEPHLAGRQVLRSQVRSFSEPGTAR